MTFNGTGFDLLVLRYRAMLHSMPAPGLRKRAYFNRFSEDAIDLCDVLASYGSSKKLKLDELAKAFGLPGKPDAMDGSRVAEFVHAGRIADAMPSRTFVQKSATIRLLGALRTESIRSSPHFGGSHSQRLR